MRVQLQLVRDEYIRAVEDSAEGGRIRERQVIIAYLMNQDAKKPLRSIIEELIAGNHLEEAPF